MHKYRVEADSGSVAVESDEVRFFFNNGYGDGEHECIVGDKDDVVARGDDQYTYVGCFEVAEDGDLHLLDYDAGGGKRIHKFGEGRWFVYNKSGDVLIEYIDNRTGF
jgi:hypothetical protein